MHKKFISDFFFVRKSSRHPSNTLKLPRNELRREHDGEFGWV
jgi:hypothetical protein